MLPLFCNVYVIISLQNYYKNTKLPISLTNKVLYKIEEKVHLGHFSRRFFHYLLLKI